MAATVLDAIGGRTTVSLGVSTRQDLDPIATAWNALLKDADANRYRAQDGGRNRVVGPVRAG